MTGGTPEAVVAGIAVGFKTIIYVASDDNEELIQKNEYLNPHLPRSNWSRVDTTNYASGLSRLGREVNGSDIMFLLAFSSCRPNCDEEKMMHVLPISEEREHDVDYMTCPGRNKI